MTKPDTKITCRKFHSARGQEHCLVLTCIEQGVGVPLYGARFDDRDLGRLDESLYRRLVAMTPAQLEHYFLG